MMATVKYGTIYYLKRRFYNVHFDHSPRPKISPNRLTQTGPGCVVPTGKKRKKEKKKSLLPFN